MLIIYIIMTLVIIISTGFYIIFVVSEGKDERGQAILGKSSQIAFIFIAFGFVFQLFYIKFAHPSVDQIEASIFIWMALVWASNSVSTFIFRKNK